MAKDRHHVPSPADEPMRGGSTISAAEVYGHVYEAQVELGYAWDMLEVLAQLTMEATERDPVPMEGWFGLLTAVQERVGAGRRALGRFGERD